MVKDKRLDTEAIMYKYGPSRQTNYEMRKPQKKIAG